MEAYADKIEKTLSDEKERQSVSQKFRVSISTMRPSVMIKKDIDPFAMKNEIKGKLRMTVRKKFVQKK